jgi:uncharacterized protein YkwD
MKGSYKARAGILSAALVLCSQVWLEAAGTGLERNLYERLNAERKKHGLHALKWNGALASAARQHAQELAKHKLLEHRGPNEPSLPARATKAGARFVTISENIVRSTSVHDAHGQFMNSPAHRGNILDRDVDSVGIGVARQGRELFVVEDFAKAK